LLQDDRQDALGPMCWGSHQYGLAAHAETSRASSLMNFPGDARLFFMKCFWYFCLSIALHRGLYHWYSRTWWTVALEGENHNDMKTPVHGGMRNELRADCARENPTLPKTNFLDTERPSFHKRF
jgi:hypothetical protein